MRKNFYGRGNNAFTCEQCGIKVLPLKNGSYRNHCPECLYSKHVDVIPGDRLNPCQGLMKPIRAEYSGKKGWVIIHECTRCGHVGRNKTALEDPEQPDEIDTLLHMLN